MYQYEVLVTSTDGRADRHISGHDARAVAFEVASTLVSCLAMTPGDANISINIDHAEHHEGT